MATDRTDVPLPLYTVLEEEFAALHPEKAHDAPSVASDFIADDIADVAGFAKAFEPSHMGHEHAPVRPPAPTGTALHIASEFVLAGQDALAAALRQYEEKASKENTDRLCAAIATRLSQLVKGNVDLRTVSAFAPFAEEVEAAIIALGGSAGDLVQRNRLIIEAAFEPYVVTTRDTRLEAIFFKIHHARHAALCLSGGGIRSASFTIGVVQSLARHGLLPRFEYLSTVSGGGYTGGWLSAWMARSGAAEVWKQLKGVQTPKLDDEPAALKHVRTYSHYMNASFGMMSADTWTITATVLRNILLIWLVTMPLIAAGLMVPRLFVAFPKTTIPEWRALNWDPGLMATVLIVVATILNILAQAHAHRILYERSGTPDAKAKAPDRSLATFHRRCLVPLVVGAICLALGAQLIAAMLHYRGSGCLPGSGPGTVSPCIQITEIAWANELLKATPTAAVQESASAMAMGWFVVFVGVSGWLIGAHERRKRWLEGVMMAPASFFVGWGIVMLFDAVMGVQEWKHGPEFWATITVPLFLSVFLLGSFIFSGLSSKSKSDAERESAARFNAWLLIVIVGWLGVFSVALFGPLWLRQGVHSARYFAALATSGAGAGILTALFGAAASTPAAGGKSKGGPVAAAKGAVTALAIPLFAVAIVVVLSVANAGVLKYACVAEDIVTRDWCPPDNGEYELFTVKPISGGLNVTASVASADSSSAAAPPSSTAAPDDSQSLLVWADRAQPQVVLIATFALLAVGVLLGLAIDTNRFSLHAMYKQRLTRTFLGASKAPCDRDPDPFTGFDETDDMPMADLWPARRPPGEHAASGSGTNTPPIRPPMHILNLALNLVGADRLGAAQGRKAECFTVSSLHAGSAQVGYRRTSTPDARRTAPKSWIGKVLRSGSADDVKLYGGGDGITLGTAVAVSGAAASPNMGYNSSPAITFLMTLFNARMGWWLGNPGPAGDRTYDRDEPRVGVVPILNEMFGRTTDSSPYVYLSDGGHFENLAVYEMIRRRNRFIIVSDAGSDPNGIFDDLGGLVRKARIDFGIPVEFSPKMNIFPRSMPEMANDGTYWAIGRVRYSAVDKDPARRPGETDADYDGIIVYIKAAYYGQEPRDVYNYAQKVPEFPHDSTANQFFGEAQVESYRALGMYSADQMWAKDFNLKQGPDGVVSKETLDAWVHDRIANWPAGWT